MQQQHMQQMEHQQQQFELEKQDMMSQAAFELENTATGATASPQTSEDIEAAIQSMVQVSLGLRLKGLFLYTVGILCYLLIALVFLYHTLYYH